MIPMILYSILGGTVFSVNGKLIHKKPGFFAILLYFLGGAAIALSVYLMASTSFLPLPFTTTADASVILPDFVRRWIPSAIAIAAVLICHRRITRIEKPFARKLATGLEFVLLAYVFADCCVLPMIKLASGGYAPV